MTVAGVAYVARRAGAGPPFRGGRSACGRGRRDRDATVGLGSTAKRLRRALSVGLLVGSAVLFGAAVWCCLRDPAVDAASGGLPGVETAIVWLFVVQMIVMVIVAALGVAPRGANRARHVALGGVGSVLVSGSALVPGAMFSAGVVLRVGDYLGQTTSALAPANAAGRVPLIVPNVLTWAARGAVVLVVILVAAAVVAGGVWLIVSFLRSLPEIVTLVRRFVVGTPAADDAQTERRARSVRSPRAIRRGRVDPPRRDLADRSGPLGRVSRRQRPSWWC